MILSNTLVLEKLWSVSMLYKLCSFENHSILVVSFFIESPTTHLFVIYGFSVLRSCLDPPRL